MELVAGNGRGWERYAGILEVRGAPPVIVQDPDEGGRIVYGNAAACAHFGVNAESLLVMRAADFDPITPAGHLDEIIQTIRQQGYFRFETLHRRTPGRLVPVEVMMAFLMDGNRPLLASYIFDVAQRKVAEERLQHYRMEAALHEQDRRYQELFANFSDGILFFEVDTDWQIRIGSLNPQAQATFASVDSENWATGASLDVLPAEIGSLLIHAERSRLVAGQALHQELLCETEAGSRYFAATLIPMLADDGAVYRLALVLRDMTERRQMEDSLAAREREYRELVENSPDFIARYDRECRRLYVNSIFASKMPGGYTALLGSKPTECPGGAAARQYEQKIRAVFATGVHLEHEFVMEGIQGSTSCSLIRLSAERDVNGDIVSVLGVGRDITELTAYRKRIHQMAYYDQLTDLPNRAMFGDRLQHLLQDAEHYRRVFAVMMIDVDRFKVINDTMGHAAGDSMLREVAQRMRSTVRRDDVVARLGGDEFAILLPGIANNADPASIAGKLLDVFREPVLIDGKEIIVSLSIGIALFPVDSQNAEDLVKYADTAMYLAKRSGRNNFKFYSRKLTDSVREGLLLEADLRRGLAGNQMELYFQPKYRLSDLALVGAEALIRWNHPEQGLVMPDRFIPFAEETGLIVEIGDWVMHSACRAVADWNLGRAEPVKLAVNLSARQFQRSHFSQHVATILALYGCRPEWVELEITESLLLDDSAEVLQAMLELREQGITIAIDDFGTGYSALNYLARYPINTLKIDRSFISQIGALTTHEELVKAMLSIARCLGQEVVAEGVETEQQAKFLLDNGCLMVQGSLYSSALPQTGFLALLGNAV